MAIVYISGFIIFTRRPVVAQSVFDWNMKRRLPSSCMVAVRERKRRHGYMYMQPASSLVDMNLDSDQLSPAEIVNDTQAALLYLKSLFPTDKFLYRVPTIILKHQLYSILENKTEVDRQLSLMQDAGEIQLFKLFSGTDEFAVVSMSDYQDHIKNCTRNKSMDVQDTVGNFICNILPKIKDVSLDRESLDNFEMTEEIITVLMNAGVLIRRDIGSWWISIPGSGQYMKNLCSGRKAILRMIKQQKYKEILERELEKRTINTHSNLGISYHLHDIIGAEMVTKVKSASGHLIRLSNVDSNTKRRKP